MKINVKWEGEAGPLRKSSGESRGTYIASPSASSESIASTSPDSFEDGSDPDLITEDEETVPKFKPLQSAAIAVAVEGCVDQFAILRSVLDVPIDASWLKLFKYKSPEQRMGLDSTKGQKFAEEEYEKIPYTYRHKLKKDICFLYATLMETCKEIVDYGTFKTITKVIRAIERQIEDDRNIAAYEEKLILQLKEVNKKILEEQRQHELDMEEVVKVTGNLKDVYEDIIGYSNCEIRYLKSWEAARRAQLNLALSNKEGSYTEIIDKSKWKIECEQRIHNEIDNYINENIDDYQNDIQNWMQEYDNEIERRDAEILNLKMEWETLTENHTLLAELYKQRAKEIDDYLEVREIRRQKEEEERLQNWAATKIQAWWRGTMVRKKLGPYGRKKKGKKGKKGKGKRKK